MNMDTIKIDKMSDPGCILIKCTDYKNGICMFNSPVCKYRQDELDPEILKDAERFQWLINQGVAWNGCYVGVWKEGEWLYAVQNAREQVDKAMKGDKHGHNRRHPKANDSRDKHKSN